MIHHLKALFLIASLIFIVYSNALSGKFVWDDEYLIVKNPWIQDPQHLPKLFTHDLHAFSPKPSSYYRPLQSLSYLLDHYVFGWNVWGFHLTSLLLHIGVAGGVYGLCCQIGFPWAQALCVSLLFGLHPTLSASVAYLSGRADLLSMLCSLGSVSAFLCFIRRGSFFFYGLSILCFALGLLSKEIVVALPGVFFLILHLFSTRKIREKFLLLSPYLVSIFFIGIFRFSLFGGLTVRQDGRPPFWHLLIFSCKSILLYMKLIFLPSPLYMERYVRIRDPFWGPDTLLGILFLVGFVWLWRKVPTRQMALGWGWFWIFIFATSPLILRLNRYAEHFLYFPLIGLWMVVLEGGSVLLKGRPPERFWRWGGRLSLLGMVVCFSLKTYAHNRDWQQPEIFYESILKHNPQSVIALNNLATLYSQKGESGKAEALLRRAIAVYPDLAEAYHNLGALFLWERRLEEAIQMYQKAAALRPESAEIHHNLASAHRQGGDCRKAVLGYRKALSLKPYLIESRYFLAECYETLGMEEEAKREREWFKSQRITVYKVRMPP